MAPPDRSAGQTWVWPETRALLDELVKRLERVQGRPVRGVEAWHAAVRLAMSASDEDLRKGEL